MKDKKEKGGLTLLICSIILLTYWLLVKNFNVYEYAILGAIYEILWVFMLGGFLLIPLLSLIFWIKAGAKSRSLFLYALIISLIAFLTTYFS